MPQPALRIVAFFMSDQHNATVAQLREAANDGLVIGITSGFFTEGQNINLAINIEEVIDLYETCQTNKRSKLSNYNKPSPTPNVTSTLIPTVKITVKPTTRPTATPYPLEGYLNFVSSSEFNYLVLKDYQGYKYDKFDEWWSYSRDIYLDKNTMFKIRLSGDKYIEDLPDVLIISPSETRSGAFVRSIDILIGDKIFTFQNLRYHNDIKGLVFFYLGSVGRQMVEDIPKAKTISFRLTFRDNGQSTYELRPQTFSPLSVWCKNIIKHKVFDLFLPRMLTNADRAHNATVH